MGEPAGRQDMTYATALTPAGKGHPFGRMKLGGVTLWRC